MTDQRRLWNENKEIPKNSENKPQGLYIYIQEPFLRGLSMEGNLRFKIDWASLIVGRKFTVFALFYFVFEGNYLEGRFNGGFLA